MRWPCLVVPLAAFALALPFASSYGSYTVRDFAVRGCGDCHGTPGDDRALASLAGLPDVATPSTTYDLTVRVVAPSVTPSPSTTPPRPFPFFPPSSPPSPARQRIGGFALLVDQGTLESLDTFTASAYEEDPADPGTPNRTDQALGHTGEGSYAREWKARWRSPERPNATVHVRWAALAANGDGASGPRDAWALGTQDVPMDLGLTPESTPDLGALAVFVVLVALLARRASRGHGHVSARGEDPRGGRPALRVFQEELDSVLDRDGQRGRVEGLDRAPDAGP